MQTLDAKAIYRAGSTFPCESVVMPERTIVVTAPSRLHFGMLSFGQPDERQYGGVGVMLDQPGLKLRLTPAAGLSADGPLAERALAFAQRASAHLGVADPQCRLEVLSAPPEHAGLGTGTQLGLAVAAGVSRFLGAADRSPIRLAQLAGRGERSAIGTYGFTHGGLLVEAGKRPGEPLSPLTARVELPAAWRFVLIRPHAAIGLHGQAERAAFESLPPVPRETTAELCRETQMHLLPAAACAAFAEFSASLYRYGHRAGMCFAANQGGPFASGHLAKLVAAIRESGVEGVGQSSWGPTLFALFGDAAAAREFVSRFASIWAEPVELTIAAPNHCGATVEVLES